jgi:mannose-6-phosphate isomerase-like protein (cupin superfamily)
MSKAPIVSDELAQKFATEKDTPYERWVRSQGLDIESATYVRQLRAIPLKPWKERGGSAVFLNHESTRTTNDAYVCEIPAGGELKPRRQIFDEMILILSGRGSTTVWNDAGARQTFEWKENSIFAVPMNCWHQHFNGSGEAPARYVAVTYLPQVINLFGEPDFVFNNAHDFKTRFNGEPDYFSTKGEQKGFLLTTNFVADAVNIPLITAASRGGGGGHLRFNMARGALPSHISQFPVGTYKRAHSHGSGAYVIVLSGRGYSMMWHEGEKPNRYDWEVGTLITPPAGMYHQHFNTGTTPARYLAFRNISIRNSQGVPYSWISRRVGGTQIDYADEPQVVRDIFDKEIAASGVTSRMGEAYARELETLPPLPEAAE